MTPTKFIISPEFRRATRRITRELLICIVLPSALLVTADLAAQNADQSQPQQSQPQQSQDEQVVNDINSRLATSGLPNPLNFNVMVHSGIATLQGTVPTAEERSKAEAFMKSIPGIKSVDNQLTVGAPANSAAAPPPPPSDEQMASPEDQQNQNPGNQNSEDQNPGNQNPSQEEHAPGPPPPPPSNPYGPPPANEQNGPPQNYQSGRFQQPMVTIPIGKPIHVMMLNGVDSKHTKPGDHFRAVVIEDVILPNGATAIPRGAYIDGSVIDSRGPGKLKGHPKLALVLNDVHFVDTSYPLSTYVWDRRGPGKGGQTAGNVVGGAAVGTVVGGFAGGGGGAGLGALIGGLGGAGLSALSSGPRLVVPPESVLTFYLNAPATVREPSVNEMRSLQGNVPPPQGGYRGGPGYGPGPYPPPGPPGGYPY